MKPIVASNPETLNSQINVGNWLGKLEQRAEAEPMLREGLAQLRVNAGIGHRFTLNAITQPGTVFASGASKRRDAGRLDAAA